MKLEAKSAVFKITSNTLHALVDKSIAPVSIKYLLARTRTNVFREEKPSENEKRKLIVDGGQGSMKTGIEEKRREIVGTSVNGDIYSL